MGFSVYNYEDETHDIEVYSDKVVVKVRGSKSYQSGEYMNERNATIRVELSHEQVLKAAEEIQEQ